MGMLGLYCRLGEWALQASQSPSPQTLAVPSTARVHWPKQRPRPGEVTVCFRASLCPPSRESCKPLSKFVVWNYNAPRRFVEPTGALSRSFTLDPRSGWLSPAPPSTACNSLLYNRDGSGQNQVSRDEPIVWLAWPVGLLAWRMKTCLQPRLEASPATGALAALAA